MSITTVTELAEAIRTASPSDRSRTPGASSDGEAAALATGMTPPGLGNDTLGSLRWPAQCCGVTTLKPALGRIPHATTIEPVDMPLSNQLLSVTGPMAQRVADLRAVLAAPARPGTTRGRCRPRCAAPNRPGPPGRARHRPGPAGHRQAGP